MAPVKHHDIASSTNCSRETLRRELGRLEKLELVAYEEHLIILIDMQKLKAEMLRI